MKVIAIIPARMGASRFPGKPMHRILGIPMIGHCFLRVKEADGIDEVYVATCDQVIADYISSIGGIAIMTSVDHTRATDRTAEAMLKIEDLTGQQVDSVIMIQGDEPLIMPSAISEILPHFDDPAVEIVNLMSRLRSRTLFEDKNNVKVVVDRLGNALYFSREPIPSPWRGEEGLPMYQQVGVIAFRRESLIHFNSLQQTQLEIIESIDMNRVLEMGGSIRMVLTDNITLGVDTLAEAKEAAMLLRSDSIYRKYSEKYYE